MRIVGGRVGIAEIAQLARGAALHVEGDEVERRAPAAGAGIGPGGAVLQELPEDGVRRVGRPAAAHLRARQRVLHRRGRVIVGLQELLERRVPVEAQVRLVPEVPIPLRGHVRAVALGFVAHHGPHQVVPAPVVARWEAVRPRAGPLRRAQLLRHEAEPEERHTLRPHDDVHDLVHQRELVRRRAVRPLAVDARALVNADAGVEHPHRAAQERRLRDALKCPLEPHAGAQQVVGHVAHDGVRERRYVAGPLTATDHASDGRHALGPFHLRGSQ